MKKFYVGCKGLIRDKGRGVLLLHREYKSGDFWDIPGGRMDDDEDIEDTLRRELNEELPGIKDIKVQDLLGAYRIHKDIDEGVSLVLLIHLVDAKLPDPVVLSEEHQDALWITSASDIPEDEGINPHLKRLLEGLLN